ncbi:hypothetical protein AAC387_Pa04g1661 [Persea americana]
MRDFTRLWRSFQFSYTVDGEERTISTRSTFDRTISITSLSLTCSKREDPPSRVKRTNVIKTEVFVGGPSGYAEKSPARIDILMPASGYHGLDHTSVDLRPVGLVGGAILKEAEIFDAVHTFRQTVVFSDEAFMAMLESFLPQTNTFIVTNGEIGFSLKELSAITGLPILRKLFEEFMPIDSVFEEQFEEFRLLYFQLVPFYNFVKEKEGLKVRCNSWQSGSFLSSNFFYSGESSESMIQEARAKSPGSKKISVMRENLKELYANTDAIYFDIALRRDLTVYLTYWLGEAVFVGGDGMHIRPHCIFLACQMTFGERLALVPALYFYLCIKLQAAAFLIQLVLPMNRLGFSQGVVGAPSSKVKRFGGLQDGRNAWAFYSAEDTTAMISYPELTTFRTASFTKWFVESFSVHRGLSKKELDVK